MGLGIESEYGYGFESVTLCLSLNRCRGVVQVGAAKMLRHISSLKALAGIRNSLHSVLSQVS